MRTIILKMHNVAAAQLVENERGYSLLYYKEYRGMPLSCALAVRSEPYLFSVFPPFLDGLLPEGVQLEALRRKYKIDADDYLSQLILVGQDLVGAITVEELT